MRRNFDLYVNAFNYLIGYIQRSLLLLFYSEKRLKYSPPLVKTKKKSTGGGGYLGRIGRYANS